MRVVSLATGEYKKKERENRSGRTLFHCKDSLVAGVYNEKELETSSERALSHSKDHLATEERIEK